VTTAVWAVLAALLAAHLDAPATGGLEVRGPQDMTLLGTTPVLPAGCATKTSPGLFSFSCGLPQDAQLTFGRPGWELREVRPAAGVVDLRDNAWVPTPWRLELFPPELAAGARLVWLAGEAVEWSTPTGEGVAGGPRVVPGEVGVVAVVGPNTAGTLLKVPRQPDEEPLPVTLAPGRSLALICREPWTWSVVANCQVVVGKPSPLLQRFGLGWLRPQAHVEREGGLFLVANYGDDALFLAQAPDLPSALGALAGNDGVVEIVFPRPRRLHLTLTDKKTGKPVTDGLIRIVALPHELLLVETTSDTKGRAEVAVGPGRVRVVAEARGFRRGEVELDIDQPTEQANLALKAATVLRGQVWDERGQPVEGALVMAAGQGMSVDGTENLAATGDDGSFEVTAPGAGPWLVWAQAEGARSATTPVHSADAPVSLRLTRDCSMSILPIDNGGNVVPVRRLVFTGLDRTAIRLPDDVEASGAIGVRLSPGRWRAWGEEEKVAGHFEVPSVCEGLLLPVVLTPQVGRP